MHSEVIWLLINCFVLYIRRNVNTKSGSRCSTACDFAVSQQFT